MKAKVNKVRLFIVEDDILSQPVNAIVNETTPNLTLPATWQALVGQTYLEELFLIGYCDVGSAILTSAGNLPHQAIIHTVGPRWGEASARGKLANATWRTLELAEENEINSIALTPISVGANGYPIENCARTMLQEIVDFTFESLKHLREIYVCTANEIEQTTFTQELTIQLQKLKDSGDGKVSV